MAGNDSGSVTPNIDLFYYDCSLLFHARQKSNCIRGKIWNAIRRRYCLISDARTVRPSHRKTNVLQWKQQGTCWRIKCRFRIRSASWMQSPGFIGVLQLCHTEMQSQPYEKWNALQLGITLSSEMKSALLLLFFNKVPADCFSLKRQSKVKANAVKVLLSSVTK